MRKISLIVIHCSATRADRDFTAKDVDTAHRFRGFSCWGYHYYIRKSGQIEPMRDEDTVSDIDLSTNRQDKATSGSVFSNV